MEYVWLSFTRLTKSSKLVNVNVSCFHVWDKATAAPKLCGLPPTTEAFEQNVYRAHFQVAQWYSALSGDPPPLNAVDYGWEADEANKCLIPRNMAGVPYAPKQILKLVKCGSVSERPCKGANCGCMGHQLPSTMFCACGVGRACLNAFSMEDADEAVMIVIMMLMLKMIAMMKKTMCKMYILYIFM